MVLKLVQWAQKRWRALNGSTLIAKVFTGGRFVDGVKQQAACSGRRNTSLDIGPGVVCVAVGSEARKNGAKRLTGKRWSGNFKALHLCVKSALQEGVSMSGQVSTTPTLADVARAAGLAQSTVSLALNRPVQQCRLAPATRKRAQEAAERLGYRPNWRARSLARQQTYTIGLLYARKTPFMTGANEAIFDALAGGFCKAGYHQLLIPVTDDAPPWQDVIRSDRLDGLVVVNPQPPELGEIVHRIDRPVVLINLQSDYLVSHVIPDEFKGAVQLTEYLVGLGHQNLAFFTAPDTDPHFSIKLRHAGFQHVVQENNAEARLFTQTTAESFAHQISKEDGAPTAIVVYDHAQAIRLLHELWRAGVQVPRDVSVATFNDNDVIARLTPPLTTMALPDVEMGEMAVDLVVKQLGRNVPKKAATIQFEETLVVRASTASPLLR